LSSITKDSQLNEDIADCSAMVDASKVILLQGGEGNDIKLSAAGFERLGPAVVLW